MGSPEARAYLWRLSFSWECRLGLRFRRRCRPSFLGEGEGGDGLSWEQACQRVKDGVGEDTGGRRRGAPEASASAEAVPMLGQCRQ